jgi:hypothetical protein
MYAYRDAALLHDKYCETKSRPWQAVHRMFYNAMRAARVGDTEANTLYYAVMLGGPRWLPPGVIARGRGSETGNPPPLPPPKVLTDADLKEFQDWIRTSAPCPHSLSSTRTPHSGNSNSGTMEVSMKRNSPCGVHSVPRASRRG